MFRIELLEEEKYFFSNMFLRPKKILLATKKKFRFDFCLRRSRSEYKQTKQNKNLVTFLATFLFAPSAKIKKF